MIRILTRIAITAAAITRTLTPSISQRADQRFRNRKACGSWLGVEARRCVGEIIQHGKGF